MERKMSIAIENVLMDQKFFDAIEQVEKYLEENDVQKGMVIQTLIFDKKVFATKQEAMDWASSHGFHITKEIDETEDSFRIRQYDPAQFIEGSFRTIEIRNGIKAVVGKLIDEATAGLYLSLMNPEGIKLSESLPSIIEICKVVEGYHAKYGKVVITKEMLNQMMINFDEKVIGVDISIDYDHETREAAGWIRSVFLNYEQNKLMAEEKWTPKGALALNDREFRYFSPEFTLNYIHPHTGKEHGCTLTGGALVNRPFLKMDAIVELKNSNGGLKMTETILLTEHKEKVSVLEKEIENLKLSEKKLSDELTQIKAEKEKAERDAAFEKLFSENKINKAQLQALKDGKGLLDVLSMYEKMNTEPKGNETNTEQVTLSEEETIVCKKLGLKPEDYSKYNLKK